MWYLFAGSLIMLVGVFTGYAICRASSRPMPNEVHNHIEAGAGHVNVVKPLKLGE